MYNKKLAGQTAQATGFRLDENTGMLHGTSGGFPMILSPDERGTGYQIHVSVSLAGQAPDLSVMREAVKETKALTTPCTVQGYHVRFTLSTAMSQAKTNERMMEALRFIPEYLSRNGYRACCEGCGQPIEVQSYNVKGSPALMCAPCFSHVSQQLAQAQYLEASKKENIIGGIVGALLGALIGGVAIVIIARLGYVAWISGVIMGVCTLQGYKMLGGKITTKGIVISVLVMGLVIYLANRVGLSMEVQEAVSKEFGSRAGSQFGFFDAFKMLPQLAREESEIGRIYYGNLAMTAIFTALGAVPTIIQTLKNRTMQGMAARI